MNGILFVGSYISQSDFMGGSDMRYADFEDTELHKINFSNVDLSYSDFSRASLEQVNFVESSLNSSSFKNSTIDKTVFDRSFLGEVTFTYSEKLIAQLYAEMENEFCKTSTFYKRACIGS